MVECSNLNKMAFAQLAGIDSRVKIINDGTKQYAHVWIEWSTAIPVPPLMPVHLGRIIVERPLAQNAAWSSELKLIREDKSRVKTNSNCTRIKLSSTVATCSDTGDPQCLPGLEASLRVGAYNNSNCALTQVKVGIASPNLQLTGVDLELSFQVSGGLTLDHFDFGDFGASGACPTNGTGCTLGTSDCYSISGNTLSICFNLAPAVPVVGIRNMNVYFIGAGCVEGVTVTRANIGIPGLTSCVPKVDPENSGLPHCSAFIGGRLATEEGEGLENATIILGPSTSSCSSCTGICPATTLSLGGKDPAAGRYGFCTSCICDKYVITPSHNVNPLNGVSTYDLVLISRHILGLETLGSPYKMIAADIDRGGNITTYDIVEERKLILGIYTQYPANTSWRFVDKSFQFPQPTNPFKTGFPEGIDYCKAIPPDPQNLDFVAIKVGDVNASAMAHTERPAPRPEMGLSWTVTPGKPGSLLTLPVTYAGEQSAEAIQLGLRFDPAVLRFMGVSKGSLPGFIPDNFNLNEVTQGKLRTLWIPDIAEPERHIQPGDVLFYVTFKVQQPMEEGQSALELDDALLENLAWTTEGVECTVSKTTVQQRNHQPDFLSEVSAKATLQATCAPNPTTGTASLTLRSAHEGKARIWVFNAYGARLFLRDIVLSADLPQEVALPELAALPTGIYLWKVTQSGERVEGRLVKE